MASVVLINSKAESLAVSESAQKPKGRISESSPQIKAGTVRPLPSILSRFNSLLNFSSVFVGGNGGANPVSYGGINYIST